MKIGNQVKMIDPPKFKSPAFKEFDAVELKSKVKGTSLKKGDKGTVMETFASNADVIHLVVFEDRKITAEVSEHKLKPLLKEPKW